ncbi:hypothetical protein BD779DRAFT_1682623 [Infundibulicybe gibba]|nr:hypothetical protein BD779DRAFT_1682623 [Infundibulicybe gibba]
MRFSSALLVAASMAPVVLGGPISYGICQSGCYAAAVICYAAAGFTFSVIVATPAIPPALLVCNAGLAACSAVCNTTFFASTP